VSHRSRPAWRSSEIWALVLILLFALVYRLMLAVWVLRFNPSALWHPDSSSYFRMALLVLKSGVSALTHIPPSHFEAQRPWGYPLLLAGLYHLVGIRQSWVTIIQVLCSVGTVLMTFLLGRRLFGMRAGLLAAFLLAIDPASVCASQVILSETVFTMLLMPALILLIHRGDAETAENSRRPPLLGGEFRAALKLIAAGLLLALATFIRPVSYYLIPILALVVLIQDGIRRVNCRPALARMVAFLILPLLLVGGWRVYRQAATGVSQFSGMEGVNTLFYRAGGTLSVKQHRTLQDVYKELGYAPGNLYPFAGYFALHPDTARLNPAQLSRRWTREGWRIILRNPIPFVLMEVRSLGQMLFDPGTFDLAHLAGFDSYWDAGELGQWLQKDWGRFFAVVWDRHREVFIMSLAGLLLLVGCYGGVALWFARAGTADWTRAPILLAVVLLYFVLISAGPESASRFRVPFAPLLMLFAASGWQLALARRAK
jgi:4-amino-4-deoxy-L-arabinose transferase-like glycosyltransferase